MADGGKLTAQLSLARFQLCTSALGTSSVLFTDFVGSSNCGCENYAKSQHAVNSLLLTVKYDQEFCNEVYRIYEGFEI